MKHKYMVPALERGLRILELLSGSPEGKSIPEMGSLQLPAATLYRLLNTLEAMGYLTKNDSDHYQLSRKLLSLGYKAADENNLITAANPEMRRLRDRSGESVLLAVLYGNEGIVLDEVLSHQAVKVSVKIGHHFPLHSAAPAKALLAFLTPEEQDRYLSGIQYTVFTPATHPNRKSLRKELDQIRMQGFAFDRGEELEELRCVAAPIFDHRGIPAGAISIGGPRSRLTDAKLKQCAGMVKESAQKITQTLQS